MQRPRGGIKGSGTFFRACKHRAPRETEKGSRPLRPLRCIGCAVLNNNRRGVTRFFRQEPSVSQRDQPRNPTSLTLLERVKANDQQAWQRLLGLYSPLV